MDPDLLGIFHQSCLRNRPVQVVVLNPRDLFAVFQLFLLQNEIVMKFEAVFNYE
tara:strand:- start:874 stop:1035 length:162 start_codon:yes stop_codon:yes gene_type:complete